MVQPRQTAAIHTFGGPAMSQKRTASEEDLDLGADAFEHFSPAALDQPPSPASTPRRLKPKPGSEEWSRQIEQRLAQEEESRVYQLALWSEHERAMPNELIRSALFAAIQGKHAEHLDGVVIASANDLTITFTGQRLTQVHADVWEGVMHLARGLPEAKHVSFRAKAFLRSIGRHTGKSQRDELKKMFRQLAATCVEVRDTKNNQRFWGSLLPRGAARDAADDSMYVVEINRELAKLFDRGFTTVDWEQRKKLKAKPLSLWLQHHFAAFDRPISVTELHRLSGSTARHLRQFRAQLKQALAELEAIGVLSAWELDDADAVHVVRGGRPLPERFRKPSTEVQAPAQSVLTLPVSGPPVSPSAKKQFATRYPGLDCEQCVRDWHQWLAKANLGARRPDAAFLGFAKTWAASRG